MELANGIMSSTVQERISEARDRDAGDGANIVLLHGFESAMVGTATNKDGKTIAVYEEGLCLKCIMERLKVEHPDMSEQEIYEDALDAWDYNTMRAMPYMGEAAPLVIQAFDVDSAKWDSMLG